MKPYKTISESFSDEFTKMIQHDYSVSKNVRNNRHLMDTKNVTIVVTEDCSLRCSYCYQHAKNSLHVMNKETARKIVDLLFKLDAEENEYLNYYNSQAIILDFIGGEPLLEIDLINYFIKYFGKRAIELNHRWAINHMISISTNGIAYLNPKVQHFINKNKDRISITITIDGNKELHDSCRKFPNGEPSYDIVAKAMHEKTKKFGRSETKLTLAPKNIDYLFEAVKNLYEEFHLNGVYANCIFEEGWNFEYAKVFYNQLKKLGDWMLDNNIEQDFFCTLFDETIGHPMLETDNNNWCGGTGLMMSFTSDGHIQPCLRYTNFNLNYKQPEITIGSLETGISNTLEDKKTVAMLDSITRRSQSTDECFYCPIAKGCAWCSAYNYEVNGTPNKRVTFICPMHKARVLANVYYWNKLFKKYKMSDKFKLYCPKEWALDIISEEEYNMLKELAGGFSKKEEFYAYKDVSRNEL